MEPHGIGIDFGSTNIKAALLAKDGRFLAEARCPNPGALGYGAAVEAIAGLVNGLCGEAGAAPARLKGVGLACPGLVDVQTGCSIFHPGFGWRQKPLARDVQNRCGAKRVQLVNDGSAAALGETLYGAAAGKRHVVLLTLGSGVGGGIVVDGALLSGRQGLAGEVGHIPVEAGGALCCCGQRGCLEQYCSTRGMVHHARKLAAQPQYAGSPMARGGELNAKKIEDAWVQGDAAATLVMERMFEYLSLGIAGLIHTFNPEMVLLGGGIMNGGEKILAPVRKKVGEKLMDAAFECPIQATQLGERSGVLGACAAL